MKYEVFLNNKKYEIEVDECSVALKGVSEVAAPAVSAPVASAPAPAPAAAPTASASGTSVVSPDARHNPCRQHHKRADRPCRRSTLYP